MSIAIHLAQKPMVRVPDSLRACAHGFVQRLRAHPFLQRCADGSITMHELKHLLVQQGKYASHFTRYLCQLISRIDDAGDVQRLANNLSEELGLGAERQLSHAQLYAEMLDYFELRLEHEPIEPATQNLVATMYMLCGQNNPASGLGALCLGAEAIVPAFYSGLINGFLANNVPMRYLDFFSIHVNEDDEHAEIMYEILARMIQQSRDNESVATHAGEIALHARMRFLDALVCGGIS